MRYLWTAVFSVLDSYDGTNPLALFLKDFFRQHPKLGSRDRRAVSHAAYCWYRAGNAVQDTPRRTREEQVLAAMTLCGEVPKPLLSESTAFYSVIGERPAAAVRRLSETGFSIQTEKIFPHEISFSTGMDREQWSTSLLRQPKLFLRLRVPSSEAEILLQKAGIVYTLLPGDCALALPNSTDVKDILPADTYVVQDLSSQRTGAYLAAQPGETWWDCCSGAGGKAILLQDLQPDVRLTATDIRPSILRNLTARFRRYRLPQPEVHVLDASDTAKTSRLFGARRFDAVLCDVPCGGSGTWARTPEEAYFFRPEKVAEYAARQKRILLNAARYAKPGGRIVYCTCSVFRAENEDVVEAALGDGMELEKAQLINGISESADSLFVAVLRKGAD